MWKSIPVFFALLTVFGCTRYEYEVTRPAEFAGRAGSKHDFTFTRPPLEYRLRTVDNRLVMRIYNNTDDEMRLLGEQSSVVDPDGQSHPLRSAPIAPHSFAKVILPPPKPRFERAGPSFGIGVGTHIGDRRRGSRYDDGFADFDDEPRYIVIVDDNQLYWDWNGEGEIRLLLSFQRGGGTFNHEFVIRRVKV